MNERERQIIGRILKVNHAGEYGAIRIYGSQIAVAKWTAPDVVAKLEELRVHEIEHEKLFRISMPSRSARPCQMLFLWSWGGAILGCLTALMGRKMIWICTEAVESAVHHHLTDQLRFLERRDNELYELIASIQTEELSHLEYAQDHRGVKSVASSTALSAVRIVTDALIAMSTSGDSVRLKRQLL